MAGLTAHVADLTAQITALTSDEDALKTANSNQATQIADLQAQIADLEARLAALQPPTVPPTDGGGSTPPALPDVTQFGASLAGTHPGPGARVYLSNGETPADVSGNVLDAINGATSFVWLSAKETGAAWLSSYLPKFKAACDAKGVTAIFTSNHEPGGGSSTCDPAVYHAGWDIAAPLCATNGILSATCLTASKGDFRKDGPSLWNQYYRDDVDLLGFDRYNIGALSGSETWHDPADICADIVGWYRSKNGTKPFAIGETGSTPEFAQQAEWAAVMRDWCLNSYVAFACWFDARQTLLTDASAAKWYGTN